MKKIKFPKVNLKKIKKKWVIGGVIVLLVVIAGARFFVMRSRMSQKEQGNSKISTTVATSTIQTSVSGTGTISYADTTDIVVPSDLTVDELLVSEGSSVTAGEVIATVDEASLALCLNEVEEAIAEVDDTISSESSSSTSQSITAGVAGRVKKIYADEDDSVVDIMKEKGALMLISADDLMMVTLEDVTGLVVGDEVVVSSGDTTTTGTVESVGETGTVVTFDDSVFAYEEDVTVTDSDDKTLGTGKAYIHQQIKVVGSNGTISSLNVSLNSTVSASTKVFTLTSSAKSAEYMQAVTEREQLVELLNTLVAIQVNGGITAPVDGMLQTVNSSSESSTATQSSGGYMMGAADESQSGDAVEVAQATENQSGDAAEVAQATESQSGDAATVVQTTEDVSVSTDGNKEQSVRTENDSNTQVMQLSATNASTTAISVVTDMNAEGTSSTTKTPAEAPFGLTGGAGAIYGTTVDMEYADKEDATEWKDCTADKTEVAAGTWYVRVKETDTAGASAAVKVEVTASETAEENNTSTNTDESKDNTTKDADNADNKGTEESEQPSGDKTGGEKSEGSTDTGSEKDTTNGSTGGSGMSSGGSTASRGSSAASTSSSSTTTTTTSSVETTSMFTIANGDKMMVTMNVDELDIGTMQVGQEAEITLDAIEGETFTGIITSVSGSASSSGGSSQYPVEIVFDKTDAMLSGMNASVEVIVEQAENVLVVPLSAIQDDGNYSYVYTGYDESTDTLSGKVQVETGLSDETNVEITAGLSEGDTVYYEMQGSEDSSSSSGMDGFSMPGGMSGMPGGDMPSGGFDKGSGGNRGQRGGMGGQ